MNYKVMQRPMFKMGGKAASQGTGITSGLDEKVNELMDRFKKVRVKNQALREKDEKAYGKR